ncbi:MAG: 30S ribosomal protein S11 [Candidatus Paceibacterota bacterium]|jgi:small subunit ribosomal protein S11|nr:30S ribosomal protein S11 [Candidatus Paceibacterota bacterium]MDD4831120.1 30S ribosomal protein S11 [Candidatus Paceibacterota bacterium]MDD4874998.1 30S ribosomal protein S11 [Candidatus Paceibacterota bacterium]
MGKKKIITTSPEQLIKEKEKIDKAIVAEAAAPVKSQAAREGKICIFSTYNNTIIVLTDSSGNAMAQKSAGGIGFKGSKKSTPFAASKVAETLGQVALKAGIKRVFIDVKGIGSGRESALRSIANQGFDIIGIKDKTPVPHNGCRPKKPRRL